MAQIGGALGCRAIVGVALSACAYSHVSHAHEREPPGATVAMRVTVTGASGLIGKALVAELRQRGAEITVLSRNPSRTQTPDGVQAMRWDPMSEPAPQA